MNMSPGLRKLALIAHVTFSVGWLGAVLAFLPLSIAGLTSQDALLVRGSYLAMDLTTWYVIVPLCLASLLSGVISSLGTRWGLFQYYWVLSKLVITVLATIVLLVHTQPISFLAGAAAKTALFSADANLKKSQLQMVIASTAALVVLLVLTAMSVYKPRGMTGYGRRKQWEPGTVSAVIDSATPTGPHQPGESLPGPTSVK